MSEETVEIELDDESGNFAQVSMDAVQSKVVKQEDLQKLVNKIAILTDEKTNQKFHVIIKSVSANKTISVRNPHTKENSRVLKDTLRVLGNPDLVLTLPDGYTSIQLPEGFSKTVNVKGIRGKVRKVNKVFNINAKKINDALNDPAVKFPTQARRILEILLEANFTNKPTQDEIYAVVDNAIKSGTIVSKQSGKVLFNFYSYRIFEKDGYIFSEPINTQIEAI